MDKKQKKKIIVAMTGASGTGYAISLIKELKKSDVEIHLVMSKWASKVSDVEVGKKISKIKKSVHKIYSNKNLAASVSSSSFLVDGMIIIPASIKTCSEIVHAHTSTLISRCADNMLKTKKPLVIAFRETPISPPALENLYKLSIYGAIIFPLSPGYYHKPKTIADIENFIIGKVMDFLEVSNNKFMRWE